MPELGTMRPAVRAHVEDQPRRGCAAVEHLVDRVVDVVERALGVEHLRQPAAVQLEDLLEVVVRADDRAPRCSSPPRTVSKIGTRMWLSAGRPTQTSLPPRASEPMACSKALGADGGRDRDVGSAEALDGGDRILLAGVHEVVGAELARGLQTLLVDVDGDDGGAGDARVLDGEVAEAADAEDGDEARRTSRRRP